MLDTELAARLARATGDPAKGRALAVKVRDHWHPVAALAVRAAVSPRAVGTAPGMGALGFAVAQSASLASTGAKAGSFILPGIGTAIGAVIGAVIGGINRGKKPQRRAEAQQTIAQLRQLPPGTPGRLIDIGQYDGIWYGLYLATPFQDVQGSRLKDHPSAMTNNFVGQRESLRNLVKLAASSPVGATLRVPLVYPWGGPAGATASIVNPGFAGGSDAFAQNASIPLIAAWLKQGIAESRNRDTLGDVRSNPDVVHAITLLTDALIATVAPNVVSLSQQVAQQPVAAVPLPVVQQARQLAPSIQQALAAQGISLTPPSALAVSSPTDVQVGPTIPQAQAQTAVLSSMFANAGVDPSTPLMQDTLAQVAQEGVTATPALASASSLPSWALPAGVAAGVVLLVLAVRK